MFFDNKERIDKLERMLYFTSTFRNRGIKLKPQPNGTCETLITDNIIMSQPFYDTQTLILLYYTVPEDEEAQSSAIIDHVVKYYPKDYVERCEKLGETCFDDYYRGFLLFNNSCDSVVFTTGFGNEVPMDIPNLDLQTEDGYFQYSLLHDDQKLDIMQVVQYFKRKDQHHFADWCHPDFDQIYEELNDTFGIGREDYLLGNGIS